MKPRRLALALLLVGSHACAFLATWKGGRMGESVGGDSRAAAEVAPAKSADRSRPENGNHAATLRALYEDPSLSRAEFLELRDELFRSWLKRDLQGAMDMIYGPSTCGRFGSLADSLRHELDEEIEKRPRDVWEWIAAGRYGSQRPKVFERWLEALTYPWGLEPVLDLLPSFQREEQDLAVAAFCRDAKGPQLQALREVAEKLEANLLNAGHAAFERGYAVRKVALAKGDPVAALEGEENSLIRRTITSLWVDEELKALGGPETATALWKMPEDVRPQAVEEALTIQRAGDFQKLRGVLEELQRQGLWELIPEENRQSAINDAVSCTFESHVQPGEMYAALAAISDPVLRRGALDIAGDCIQLPEYRGEVEEALATTASGPDRDAFIVGMLRDLHDDPALARDLIGRISDEALRQENLNGREEMEEEAE